MVVVVVVTYVANSTRGEKRRQQNRQLAVAESATQRPADRPTRPLCRYCCHVASSVCPTVIGANTAEKLEGTSRGIDADPFRFPPPIPVSAIPSTLLSSFPSL